MSAAHHYTAVLEIHRTTVSTPPTERYAKAEPPTREVAEVARVVIRAATLEALRDKIAAHAALIDGDAQ